MFLCVAAHARDLSLKGGLILRDAEIKGVSGRNIVLVGHAGGVGMYSYTLFTPESASVISNLYPQAAMPLPAPEPPPAGLVGLPGAEAAQPVAGALADALVANARLLKEARVRLDAAIKRERAELVAGFSKNKEKQKLEKEATRLEGVVNRRDEELTDHNIYRGQTQSFKRELRNNSDRLTWDEEHTLLYQELRDKRNALGSAETRLTAILESEAREVRAFDLAAFERQQALNRVFDNHNTRIKMQGELLTVESMEADFDSVE